MFTYLVNSEETKTGGYLKAGDGEYMDGATKVYSQTSVTSVTYAKKCASGLVMMEDNALTINKC